MTFLFSASIKLMREYMDISLQENETTTDSLSRFTKTLIERDDLSQIGPEVVTTLLAIHYYSNTASDDTSENNLCPNADTLVKATGLSRESIAQGLNSLYESGYLSREDFFNQGENHTIYRVRDREFIYDADGIIHGELSWDKKTPSELFGLKEFNNILASGTLADAKIVQIEHMQVNVSNIQEKQSDYTASNFLSSEQKKSNHINSNRENSSSENSTLEPELNFDSLAKSKSEDFLKYTNEPSISENISYRKKSENKKLDEIYRIYSKRLYQDFSEALETARSLSRQALDQKNKHALGKPPKPLGLWSLIFKKRWQEKLLVWQKKSIELEESYQSSISETKRLLNALEPHNNKQPLYIEVALQQIKQDYPEFSSEISQQKQHSL